MTNKEAYRIWVKTQPELPVFFQDWWLNAVCTGGSWEVAMVRDKEERIRAVMPYFKKRKWGLPVVSMPPLTPGLGPWYADGWVPSLSKEHQVLEELLQALPRSIYIRQKWMPQRKNGLPPYWMGFRQQVYYQHVIYGIKDWRTVREGFSSEVRRRIRKLSAHLKVERSNDLEAFYRLLTATFHRQSLSPPYTFSFLHGLHRSLADRERVQLWCVKDGEDRWHAALFLVWDAHYLYSLASATDPLLRKSGGYSLLVATVLRELGHLAPAFNFAGSMVKSIATMNESFGAEPIPYTVLRKSWWGSGR